MKVNADEEVSPECSESISVLTNGNKKVIVIGTAHISEESAKLVERTIRKVNPNTVMIELDPKRIENFSNITALANYGFDTPTFALSEERSYQSDNQLLNRQPNLFISILNSIKSVIGEAFQVLSGALLGTLLSQFYRSIEKLGFTAGGEFKTAIKEARKVGARILLGDRDVDITLQHLSTALAAYPTESFERLLKRLEATEAFDVKNAGINESVSVNSDSSLNKERMSAFIESLKEREGLRLMSAILKEEVPLVYKALIGERDQFMARAISEGGETSKGSGVLVGVVGMMHLDGIEQFLISDHGYRLVNGLCPKVENSMVDSKLKPSRTFENSIIS